MIELKRVDLIKTVNDSFHILKEDQLYTYNDYAALMRYRNQQMSGFVYN